jgi:hypothetical protein
MAIDVDQGWLAGSFVNKVGIPNLFVESTRGHSFGFSLMGGLPECLTALPK